MTTPAAVPSPSNENLASAVAEQVALIQLNQQILAAFAPPVGIQFAGGHYRATERTLTAP